MNRKWFILMMLCIISITLTLNNCTEEEYLNSGIPVAFDRSAGVVSFGENGNEPVFQTISTVYPVLVFAGMNLSGDTIAYTSLEATNVGPISYEESLNLTLDDLVPTGLLYTEKNGITTLISKDGESFVTSATWSPTNPNLLAYGYTNMGSNGLVVVDVSNSKRIFEYIGDLSVDYLIWNDEGTMVGAYENLDWLETEFPMNEEEFETSNFGFRFFNVFGSTATDKENHAKKGHLRFQSFNESFELDLPYGRILSPHFLGSEEMILRKENGEVLTFKADQIRGRSDKGLVFVNTDGQLMELFATNGSGNPVPVASTAALSYYIPNPAGSTVNFIQVGQAYSGGGCTVSGYWSHTSSSTMKYAIDIQLTGSTYDQVIASADGKVVNGYGWDTCNYGDTSSCADNRSSCAKNFGNYVILAHSDGYWTLYGHMEATNYQVHSSGVTAWAGCWLGDEGHTGWTSGNKYDTQYGSRYSCGDHVHFQKQNGSSTGSQSYQVSFVEDSSITSGDCTTKKPQKVAMSCSL